MPCEATARAHAPRPYRLLEDHCVQVRRLESTTLILLWACSDPGFDVHKMVVAAQKSIPSLHPVSGNEGGNGGPLRKQLGSWSNNDGPPRCSQLGCNGITHHCRRRRHLPRSSARFTCCCWASSRRSAASRSAIVVLGGDGDLDPCLLAAR